MTESTGRLVEATGLSRRYGPVKAVDGVDINLRPGEILGLLGPNGAGKTTTLRMLAGCLAPHAGQVRIGGIDMAEQPARAKAQLGYLPERPPLHTEMTVNEYLRFCMALRRIPRGERRQAMTQTLADCGLETVGGRVIGNLSKGFQQRVGIAQAIIHRPAVVILDEPTVGLDPNQMRDIRDLIRRLGERHSVLLSSHILSEIQATCSRVMIISSGRAVFNEAMDAINGRGREKRLLASFSGSPDAAALEAIEGITQAQRISQDVWRLQCSDNRETGERLVSAAAREQWGLFELKPEERRLEDVFSELTGTRAAVSAA